MWFIEVNSCLIRVPIKDFREAFGTDVVIFEYMEDVNILYIYCGHKKDREVIAPSDIIRKGYKYPTCSELLKEYYISRYEEYEKRIKDFINDEGL